MSIKLVKVEIKRFLKSSEPEVLCIKGKWGVGKTFTWNGYLKQAQLDKNIGLSNYSYVSLFGKNSIEELKYAIFENTYGLYKPSGMSIFRKGNKLINYLPDIKGFKNVLPDKSVFFSAVRNQLICIDDLERAGEDITIKNVLGLVSLLKEQRKCKVILLLNDEVLKDTNKDDFKTHLEKVIDVEMNFIPTPSEAVEIAVDKSISFYEKFSDICIKLGLTNIRVIRKIQKLAKELEKLLLSHDRRVFESALTSIIIFGWILYQKDDLIPSIEFIKKYSFFNLDKEEPEKEKNWRSLIFSINFINFDDFDELLLESMNRGYFNPEEIESKLKEADAKLSLDDKTNSFHNAWGKYRDSFDNNEAEVLNEIFVSFKNNVQSISPTNADHTIQLLRKFNRDVEADELINFYMENRKEKREFYDPNYSHFIDIKDSVFLTAFQNKLASFKDTRTPKEILIGMVKNSGWNAEDTNTLSQLSSDDYYNLFKQEKGDNLHIITSQALKLGHYTDADEKMKKITKEAEKALIKIAKESKINEERVKGLGVVIGSEEKINE